MDWATLLNDYGFPATLFLLLASHAKNILTFVERLLSKIWPSFAEQQRLKLERAMAVDERAAEQQRLKQEQMGAEAERKDTILALKDMIIIVRESLRDERTERRLDKEQLYQIIGRHEQLDTQIVEVIRNVGDVILAQTKLLERISVKVGVYNAKNQRASHDKS